MLFSTEIKSLRNIAEDKIVASSGFPVREYMLVAIATGSGSFPVGNT